MYLKLKLIKLYPNNTYRYIGRYFTLGGASYVRFLWKFTSVDPDGNYLRSKDDMLDEEHPTYRYTEEEIRTRIENNSWSFVTDISTINRARLDQGLDILTKEEKAYILQSGSH